MDQLRYGPRPTATQDDREVTATKIGAWSTSLTATFLTDPDVVAAVLPPPLEPPEVPTVKVSISRVDLGGGRPPFGAGTSTASSRPARPPPSDRSPRRAWWRARSAASA